MEEPTTFRYKLSQNVMDEIRAFSQLHKNDERDDYKNAWNDWLSVHSEMINVETTRLRDIGYNGNVSDKMFKAGRYYFRKLKKNSKSDETKKRRVYVSMSGDVVDSMDTHIKGNLKTNEFTPASGYDAFCLANADMLSDEVQRLKAHIRNEDDIGLKIKKTYKNRYFTISRDT